jgi:glucose-1-phosphate thymidylyltransferase, short form
MIKKGIILAAGSGSRLYPITRSVSKPLLPVYDKPMIYYPLSVLMLAGIREILLITAPTDQALFKNLFGDGGQWGIEIQYEVQSEPKGIAQAFSIGKDFANGEGCALVLGDNIFYGPDLESELAEACEQVNGATIFAYQVENPFDFGVIEFDGAKKVLSLEEKPAVPKSDYAVTGLYFYDALAFDYVKELTPSARGELEITDLNKLYLREGTLKVRTLGQGYAWLDTGTNESLLQAANFIAGTEERLGLKIACLEEIAWRKGWIAKEDVACLAEPLAKNTYGRYLKRILAK